MKNIWKILIAVMAITLVLVSCDTEKNKPEEKNDFKAGTGVFSIAGEISEISTSWGGSPASPTFSVLLLKDAHVTNLESYGDSFVKGAPVDEPIYQLGAYGNMTFPTVLDGTYRTTGGDDQYTGVVANIDGENFTLFVDMSNLIVTDLKMLAADAEQILTSKSSADLTGYKPYVIALLSDEASRIGAGWSADVIAMEIGATFPATIDAAPEKVEVTLDITFKDGSKLILTDVEVWKGFDSAIDGSVFSWNGGTAGSFKAEAAGDTITVEATADSPNWALEQGLEAFETQPEGSDGFAKFAVGGGEGFVPYKVGGTFTYSWADKK